MDSNIYFDSGPFEFLGSYIWLLFKKIPTLKTRFILDGLLPPFSTSQDDDFLNLNFDAMSFKTEVSATPSVYALTEKCFEFPDNPIFVFIRANEKRNIDIAQSCNKWVFSPQTEKKVLSFDNVSIDFEYLICGFYYHVNIIIYLEFVCPWCINL